MAQQRRFYTWRKCSTCRNAKKALDELAIDVEERDFFEDPMGREELREIIDAAGIDNVFSWRSPSAKEYRQRRESISEDELIDAMLGEPRLIRRPIVFDAGSDPIVGFDKSAYAALSG